MTIRLAQWALLVALPLALGACADAASTGSQSSPAGSAPAASAACPPVAGSADRRTTFSAPPPMCIDQVKSYTATVTTDVGDFTIALDAKAAPKTVNNFVVLSRYRFYEGVPFHRVLPGFVVQGGDPQGTGRGGPGYQFADELPAPGSYKVGSVAMANAGPNTNGSQFFIVTGEKGVALQPDYTLFGQVTTGMDVVGIIEKDGSESGTPAKKHTITKVTIAEK